MRPTSTPAFASHLRPLLLLVSLLASGALAQEPEAPAEAAAPERPRPPRRQRPPETTLAILAGHVHPVSGPSIEDGVVVVRGRRIVAVGKRGEVEIPESAQTLSYPEGHVYPGLVDALTDAYTDQAQRGDSSTDAGSPITDVLRPRGDREDELLRAGITTAFVGSRASVAWRGLGAIVRPAPGGFSLWEGKSQAGVQFRLTPGPGASHPLQRLAAADAASALFDSLEAYEKTFTDHKEAVEKHQKEFEAWLDFHRKKTPEGGGKEPAKEGEAAPAPAPVEGGRGTRARPGGQPGGQTGGGRGQGGGRPPRDGGEERPAVEAGRPAQEPAAAPAAAAGDAGKPPPRPTWPKEPARDPAKDALLRVQKGELPLRVEGHRTDEVRAALQLRSRHKLPQLVLEQAYGAAALAREIADAGVPCVLTEVTPSALPAEYREHEGYDPAALPGLLHKHGVAVAIATGSAKAAPSLPLMAAAAVGAGLEADAALRAITLTPAEVLGLARDVGSLEPGKLADLIVCDRPLLQSDSRVLRVLTGGQTGYEAR
jgi:imidazolonepropionase-like amidohydrolase